MRDLETFSTAKTYPETFFTSDMVHEGQIGVAEDVKVFVLA
jgi:hypothetical protein